MAHIDKRRFRVTINRRALFAHCSEVEQQGQRRAQHERDCRLNLAADHQAEHCYGENQIAGKANTRTGRSDRRNRARRHEL